MADQNEIALVIWIKDVPIRGGIISLLDISLPKKEYEAYKEGDVVYARCRGFKGKHECLLGRIGAKSRKSEFDALLLGTSFLQILEEFGLHQHAPNKQSQDDSDVQNDTLIQEVMPQLETTVTKEVKQKEKRKNASPKKRTSSAQLVQIANDLELTELQNSVEFSDSAESSYVSAFHKPETPSKRKCVGSAIRGGLLALDHDSKEIHDMDQSPVKADCSCGCKAEIERLSAKCKTFEQEFTATWYWINLMYNQIQQKQLPNTPSHMQLLQGSSGHGQLQMPTMEEAPQPLTLMTTPVKTPHVLSSEIKKTTAPTYGGFTKSQLIEEIAGFGVEDYPKAAKRLFRRIYKEEEWQGHTLTGTKANNKYDGRPAIEDPSRMNIIYEIMQEQYRVTPVQVREKIRDLLKPSKLKKQF